jgi:outer membrane receptor for ferrienterochelin and colicin
MIEEVERDAAFTPPYTLTARLNIHILDSWYIHCSAEYVSEQNNYYSNYDDYPFVTMDNKTLENYVLINVAVSRTVFKHITIACAVKNVTDVKYARQFGNTIDDHDYPMPGRTWCAQCMVEY